VGKKVVDHVRLFSYSTVLYVTWVRCGVFPCCCTVHGIDSSHSHSHIQSASQSYPSLHIIELKVKTVAKAQALG
jgi:hypothetical protein